MRIGVFVSAALLLISALSAVCANDSPTFDWGQWRALPVQDGGRQKPFDTLAWETFRTISNRTRMVEPESGQRLDANTLYLVMLLEWQGWDRLPNSAAGDPSHPGSAYFRGHQPDRWDRMPLLRVDFLALREALGIPADQKYISPLELSQATFKAPGDSAESPFLVWAESLLARQDEGLTIFEEKSLELADKFWSYQAHRMGQRLAVVPIGGSEDQAWIPLAELVRSPWDDTSDPSGLLRQARDQFLAARAAYLNAAAEPFNQASAGFLAAVEQLGPSLGLYPTASKIAMEVAYNQWAPFRWAWVFSLIAFVALLLSMGTGWRVFYLAGWSAFAASLVAMIVGFAMRVSISGRAPVTNMYESVVYVGMGVAVFGMIFELLYRRRFVLTAAAAVATVALVLADNCPAALDPSLRPLQPVLRSNFWLITHVMTITLSYAALALAMGIGNITLGYFLVGSRNSGTINSLTNFTYRAIQVGVLLLAAGTILGGVWADYSWGRFWGWDPKEVWALIALLGYLAVLHARYVGWVRQFGLAALSVTCFSLVVMAWYGVNFVLGAGLHSYGFGGGGKTYVMAAIAAQLLYVGAAGIRHSIRQAAQRDERKTSGPAAAVKNGYANPLPS